MSTTRKQVAIGYEPDRTEASEKVGAAPLRLRFADVARFAGPDDNVAVVTRTVESASVIEMPDGKALRIDFTVLEGHRFATQTILPGQLLLSWGSGFGKATKRINAGEAVGAREAASPARDLSRVASCGAARPASTRRLLRREFHHDPFPDDAPSAV